MCAGAITDVEGVLVGHWTDQLGVTGCTVVVAPDGTVGGVDVRGAAPGTRETDLLRPGRLVRVVHAVLIAGGSAFGLDAAVGVMRYLEERGRGLDVQVARVPIVSAAVIFDLHVGSPAARPGPEAGYQACLAARDGSVAEGSVGAGTGATVGKHLGPDRATKGGLGTCSLRGAGCTVGALAVVNAFGDVYDPVTGRILAGARGDDGRFVGAVASWRAGKGLDRAPFGFNTTVGVVATDVRLTKEEVNKVAELAHNGLARSIVPAHTMYDGDVVFALATGTGGPGNVNVVGALAAEAMATAIVRAVEQAEGRGGIPSVRELNGEG